MKIVINPPAFDVSVRGGRVPVGVLLQRLIRKKTRMMTLPNGGENLIGLLVSMQYTNVTNGRTEKQAERQTPHDGIGRAMYGVARQ